MKSFLTLLGILLYAFSFNVAGAYDWNWMNCHNGTYHTSPNRHCVCNRGWGGIDCSLCNSSSVCGEYGVCANGIWIGRQKSFSCFPDPDLGLYGAVTSQWDFTNPQFGTGIISVFLHMEGAPLLFNCTLGGCQLSRKGNTERATCSKTSCLCTSWCDDTLKEVVEQLTGSIAFECLATNSSSGKCSVDKKGLGIQIVLSCRVAGCESPYHPIIPNTPEGKLSLVEVVAIGTGGATFLLFIIIGVMISYVMIKKADPKAWEQLEFGEGFQATLSFNNISCVMYEKGARRSVLNNISGIAFPGQITAILGPSGAGKTSFLDILAGRKNIGEVRGTILVNGLPKGKDFKRISGYVLQDDTMLGTLTVREHLVYVASLRLPSVLTQNEIGRRVDQVLRDLGIHHIADSMIGTNMNRGISGGERKRLSIAAELVTNPSILFLDEPTSGLDSFNAFTLMKTLKALAVTKNRTIVISIHQPRSNIYQLFDSILLLSHGEMVFFGPTADSLEHFELLGHECPSNYNPADFFIDLVTINSATVVTSLAQKYKRSRSATNISGMIAAIEDDKETNDRDSSEYASFWLQQCWILCKKTLLNNYRDPHLLKVQYILTVVFALFIGSVFWHVHADLNGVQNRAGAAFFMLCLITFGSMSSIDLFFRERILFLRERANGLYRTSAYFVAKTLCDIIPMRVGPALCLGSIAYFMVGFKPELGAYLFFLYVLVLVSLISSGVCFAISAFVPNLGTGNLLGLLVFLFSMLFGGFLVNKGTLPVFISWMKWLSFINYAFELLMVNELNGLQVWFNPAALPKNVGIWEDGWVFLKQFDLSPDRFGIDISMLNTLSFFYLLLAYLLLRFGIKERR